MKLPTKPTEPKTSLGELTILVYGRPKVGKSTFCSQFPHVVFLATEPGLNCLRVRQIAVKTWTYMLEACAEIARGEHHFKTIVVDTIDIAYKLCAQYTCDQLGIKHLADAKYGKGYGMANNEFQRVLMRLAELPTGLVLTSHAGQLEVEERTGSYQRTIPTLPGKAREIITGMADMILFADLLAERDKDGNTITKHVIHTQPTREFEAGDRTGKLPPIVPLDYAEFLAAFNGKDSPK